MKHNTNLTTVTVTGLGPDQQRRVELDRRAVEHVLAHFDSCIFAGRSGQAQSPTSKVVVYLAEHLRDLLEAMPGDGLDVMGRCQQCGEFHTRESLRYNENADLLCIFCLYDSDSDRVEEEVF